MKLSEKEIARRMQEWRNLKLLNEKVRARNKKLKKENKRQKEEIKELKADNLALRALVEKQALQIEELQEIVFGKKKKDDSDISDDSDVSDKPKKEKKIKKQKRAISARSQNRRMLQKQRSMRLIIVRIVGNS